MAIPSGDQPGNSWRQRSAFPDVFSLMQKEFRPRFQDAYPDRSSEAFPESLRLVRHLLWARLITVPELCQRGHGPQRRRADSGARGHVGPQGKTQEGGAAERPREGCCEGHGGEPGRMKKQRAWRHASKRGICDRLWEEKAARPVCMEQETGSG